VHSIVSGAFIKIQFFYIHQNISIFKELEEKDSQTKKSLKSLQSINTI